MPTAYQKAGGPGGRAAQAIIREMRAEMTTTTECTAVMADLTAGAERHAVLCGADGIAREGSEVL